MSWGYWLIKQKSSVANNGHWNQLAVMLKTFELQAKAGENKDSYRGYINQFVSETDIALKELDLYLGK